MKEDDWKNKLTPEQYRVLRQKHTEPPFSGALLHNDKAGDYVCGACGALLFPSEYKFDSGSGWPSFNNVSNVNAVRLQEDTDKGLHRVEVTCARCGSHLGHVFHDAPSQPTGMRFCVNSTALLFKPRGRSDA